MNKQGASQSQLSSLRQTKTSASQLSQTTFTVKKFPYLNGTKSLVSTKILKVIWTLSAKMRTSQMHLLISNIKRTSSINLKTKSPLIYRFSRLMSINILHVNLVNGIAHYKIASVKQLCSSSVFPRKLRSFYLSLTSGKWLHKTMKPTVSSRSYGPRLRKFRKWNPKRVWWQQFWASLSLTHYLEVSVQNSETTWQYSHPRRNWFCQARNRVQRVLPSGPSWIRIRAHGQVKWSSKTLAKSRKAQRIYSLVKRSRSTRSFNQVKAMKCRSTSMCLRTQPKRCWKEGSDSGTKSKTRNSEMKCRRWYLWTSMMTKVKRNRLPNQRKNLLLLKINQAKYRSLHALKLTRLMHDSKRSMIVLKISNCKSLILPVKEWKSSRKS